MKAKLIKKADGYVLGIEDKVGIKLIATNSEEQQKILDKTGTYCEYKLSLKNCQAIERGYDLDELADEIDNSKIRYSSDEYEEWKAYRNGLNDALEKALEILGDKKFSEEDINNAMNWIMTQYFEFYEQPTTGRREHYIQSLQQTEWDVSFNPEEKDSEGYLVLKRL